MHLGLLCLYLPDHHQSSDPRCDEMDIYNLHYSRHAAAVTVVNYADSAEDSSPK